MRDQVTCDSFLDTLGDPELAFKIRARQPSDLDSALRIAHQLEVWAKEMHRHREAIRPEKNESRRVREINRKHDPNTETPKEVDSTKKFVGYGRGAPRNPNTGTYASGHRPPAATRYAAPSVYSGPAVPPTPRGQYPAQSYNGYRNRNGNFYSIALLTHFLDVIIVEIRHIELASALHGLTSRRHCSLNHLDNSNPMSHR